MRGQTNTGRVPEDSRGRTRREDGDAKDGPKDHPVTPRAVCCTDLYVPPGGSRGARGSSRLQVEGLHPREGDRVLAGNHPGSPSRGQRAFTTSFIPSDILSRGPWTFAILSTTDRRCIPIYLKKSGHRRRGSDKICGSAMRKEEPDAAGIGETSCGSGASPDAEDYLILPNIEAGERNSTWRSAARPYRFSRLQYAGGGALFEAFRARPHEGDGRPGEESGSV
jgi:hypothetical protein